MRRSLFAFSLACAASLPAQDVRQAERRFDSVLARERMSDRRYESFRDSATGELRVRDTLRSGVFTIVTQSDLLSLVDSAAKSASAKLHDAAGSYADTVRSVRISVTNTEDGKRIILTVARRLWYDWAHRQTSRAPDSIAAQLVEIGKMAMSATADSALRRWAFSALTPDTVPTTAWLLHRVNMVSNADVSTRCFAGDVEACKRGLRLTATADPVVEWYSAKNRRTMVELEKDRAYATAVVGTKVVSDCLAGDDKSCIAFVRKRGPGPYPIPPNVREGVVSAAMQIGGTGSYERLMRAKGSMADHLVAAAGVPLDSILKVWTWRLRETRLPSQDMSLGIAAGALFWVVAFGALSLRSSRWR